MDNWSEVSSKAAAGDREAQAQMLAPFLSELRTFIRVQAGAHLRAYESVSDLLQSVCREVLQDLAEVELSSEVAFRRWLLATASRKLVDRARHHGAKKRGGGRPAVPLPTWLDVDPVAIGAYSRLVGPIEEVIAAETQARIEAAMQPLSEDERRVILLIRIQQLSHAEAAQELCRTEGATRVLLFRALARLAKAMDGEKRELP